MDAISLPKVLQNMSFNIVLKKGGASLPDRCILERFDLNKKEKEAKITQLLEDSVSVRYRVTLCALQAYCSIQASTPITSMRTFI